MKPTLILAAVVVTALALTARADTKDKLLHAHLADELGGEQVTSFSKDVPKIYAMWKGGALEEGEKVRGVWIAEDKSTKLQEGTVTATAGTISMEKPDKGWPVGKYRLELYVGDTLAETLKFTITEKE